MTQEIQIQIIRNKNEISEMNKQLSDILNKVLINEEFLRAGDAAPYSSTELHTSAEACRNRIRELGAENEALKSEG